MPRIVDTPRVADADFSKGGARAYWKRVLPRQTVGYTGKDGKKRTIDFNDEYLNDVVASFENKALDQTPFMLADKDNAHTMDPERYRGEVVAMRRETAGEEPGLYAKVAFASKKAAKAVLTNPKLAVSARIREDFERDADGQRFPRAAIHVLGTLDPKIPNLGDWTPALDLSEYAADELIDLSHESYSEAVVAKTKTGKKDVELAVTFDIEKLTDDDIAKFTDAELDAFLAQYAPDATDDDATKAPAAAAPGTQTDADDEDEDDDQETKLSNKAKADIDFANSRAETAQRDARAALNRAAGIEWAATRKSLVLDGVPPHVLDLAEPVLSRANDTVIDLSNFDEDDLNVTEIVRDLVDGYKGTVDLSEAAGHGGGDADDASNKLLERLKAEMSD